jgi:lipid A 4'-phosphatase
LPIRNKPGGTTPIPLSGGAAPFWKRLPAIGETAAVGAVGATLAVLGIVAMSRYPGLDLAASRAFWSDGGFVFAQSAWARALRGAFLDLFPVWYSLIAAAGLIAWRYSMPVLRLDARRWAYMAAASFAGPLLLANVLLKEHSGRVRPRDLAEFGGAGSFTVPLDWSGACPANCSFVSGEVSSMAMAFVALALVSTLWRPVFYAAAVLFAALVAVLRIGQGGHFLSDTLAATGLMTMLAAALYALFFLRGRN